MKTVKNSITATSKTPAAGASASSTPTTTSTTSKTTLNRNSSSVSELNRRNNALSSNAQSADGGGGEYIPYGNGEYGDEYYNEGWYQDEYGEWYQDPTYTASTTQNNTNKTQENGSSTGHTKRPDNYDEGWYQDENGDWLNQYDWHQDENGDWYYEDSSYENYDYTADGWYQDESGEWVQDTSLIKPQPQQPNGSVPSGAQDSNDASKEAAKEASKQVIKGLSSIGGGIFGAAKNAATKSLSAAEAAAEKAVAASEQAVEAAESIVEAAEDAASKVQVPKIPSVEEKTSTKQPEPEKPKEAPKEEPATKKLPPRPADYDYYYYEDEDGNWRNEYDDLGYEFDPEKYEGYEEETTGEKKDEDKDKDSTKVDSSSRSSTLDRNKLTIDLSGGEPKKKSKKLPPRPPDYDYYWYQDDDGNWRNEYDDEGYEFAEDEYELNEEDQAAVAKAAEKSKNDEAVNEIIANGELSKVEKELLALDEKEKSDEAPLEPIAEKEELHEGEYQEEYYEGYYDPDTGEWIPTAVSGQRTVARERWNWAFNKIVQVSTKQTPTAQLFSVPFFQLWITAHKIHVFM